MGFVLIKLPHQVRPCSDMFLTSLDNDTLRGMRSVKCRQSMKCLQHPIPGLAPHFHIKDVFGCVQISPTQHDLEVCRDTVVRIQNAGYVGQNGVPV